MDNENLLQRVQLLKKELGVSYKFICKKCNIPISTFYNFTGRVRNLPQEYVEKLQGYLENMGY